MFRFVSLAIPALVSCTGVAKAGEPPPLTREKPMNVTDVLLDGENCRGAHVSTRPHNRKVVYHAPTKTWFVFYGTGHWTEKQGDAALDKEFIAYRTSADGRTFTPIAPAIAGGQGHSSSTDVLLVGDRIYVSEARFGHWRTKAGVPTIKDGKMWWDRARSSPDGPNFYCPFEVFPFEIRKGRLVPGTPAEALPGDRHVGHAGPHYGSLTRDSRGYFWVAARAQAKQYGRMAVWVARSAKPDDITAWRPHEVLFESTGPGTLAPQIIALDGGRVACVLFAQHASMTAVFLYDPSKDAWSKPHVLGKATDSKRACAVFDPGSRRLHVVYTDENADARHRALSSPYRPADWSPPLNRPGNLVARKVGVARGDDDLSLSADLSKNPAPLALVCRGPDRRLHLRYYDGKSWSSKDVKVGLPEADWSCDEASAVADFSGGLGFVYFCQPKDPAARKRRNNVGQLRFCLIRDVAALFKEK